MSNSYWRGRQEGRQIGAYIVAINVIAIGVGVFGDVMGWWDFDLS